MQSANSLLKENQHPNSITWTYE